MCFLSSIRKKLGKKDTCRETASNYIKNESLPAADSITETTKKAVGHSMLKN
jgi:hypothetical protein